MQFVAANWFSVRVQNDLRLSNAVPHFNSWKWLAFGLILLLVIGLESGFRQLRHATSAQATTKQMLVDLTNKYENTTWQDVLREETTNLVTRLRAFQFDDPLIRDGEAESRAEESLARAAATTSEELEVVRHKYGMKFQQEHQLGQAEIEKEFGGKLSFILGQYERRKMISKMDAEMIRDNLWPWRSDRLASEVEGLLPLLDGYQYVKRFKRMNGESATKLPDESQRS
jgi:hypothetical protein